MGKVLFVIFGVVGLVGVPAARADHVESYLGPGEPTRDFPSDFVGLLPVDRQAGAVVNQALFPWTSDRVGGWGGGGCPAGHAPRRPVIFVHGNTEAAGFWRASESGTSIVNVRQRFLDAGWCADELWAISYDGAGGYFTYNDINAEEVFEFVDAVRAYTEAGQVDVVAHSLGVTVVRKAAAFHPVLTTWMANFVGIAGANHGTTTCRGAGTAHLSHGCEELEPGSAWLAALNGAGETPAGPRYLTIYDGSGVVDTFYVGPDAQSPALAGACNVTMPFVAHNTLARGLAAVEKYQAFLTGVDCSALP